MSANTALNDKTKPSSVRPVSPALRPLRALGIPLWLLRRPRLPSRNWLIFYTVTGTILGCYGYDRVQCRKIREHYTALVRPLSQEPLAPQEHPRHIRVFAARYPELDAEEPLTHFKIYVKPYLVAAGCALDYTTSAKYGGIMESVRKELRGVWQGTDADAMASHQRQMKDGVALVGRHTLKEYMAGVHLAQRSVDYEPFNLEEHYAKACLDADMQNKNVPDVFSFDHVEDVIPKAAPQVRQPPDDCDVSADLKLPDPQPSKLASILGNVWRSAPSDSGANKQLPPALFYSYDHPLGFTKLPLHIWNFFNKRKLTLEGAEAALSLLHGPLTPVRSSHSSSALSDASSAPALSNDDFDFDVDKEAFIKKSFTTLPVRLEEERKAFYETLSRKANALRKGEVYKDDGGREQEITRSSLMEDRVAAETKWDRTRKGWEVAQADIPIQPLPADIKWSLYRSVDEAVRCDLEASVSEELLAKKED